MCKYKICLLLHGQGEIYEAEALKKEKSKIFISSLQSKPCSGSVMDPGITGLWSVGSDLDWESGSGSRTANVTNDKREK